MSIAVLIPVLNRPKRVKPLVENLDACSKVIECRPVFIVSESDGGEQAALDDVGIEYLVLEGAPEHGDYARKINHGFAMSNEPFVFLAADDLYFHPGWAERAIATWHETGACVIGTNDMGNQRVIDGSASTHNLVRRDYWDCGTADEEGLILHEGYWHNFVDDEFVQTAKWRETFAHAPDCLVEHLHPNWGKAPEDPTYRRGMEHFNDDRSLFNRRERLWT